MESPSLPDRIRALRAQRSWTQEALANKLGVVRVTVANWEAGKIIPRRGATAALERLMGSASFDDTERTVPTAGPKRGDRSGRRHHLDVSVATQVLSRGTLEEWWCDQNKALVKRGIHFPATEEVRDALLAVAVELARVSRRAIADCSDAEILEAWEANIPVMSKGAAHLSGSARRDGMRVDGR